MIHNLHAFSFEIQSVDDTWYVFCTPMVSDNKAVIVDLWCPENPVFTGRESISLNEDVVGAVRNYIFDIVRKNHLNINTFKILEQ